MCCEVNIRCEGEGGEGGGRGEDLNITSSLQTQFYFLSFIIKHMAEFYDDIMLAWSYTAVWDKRREGEKG